MVTLAAPGPRGELALESFVAQPPSAVAVHGREMWFSPTVIMNASFRLATVGDIDRLIPLMHDFYTFERLPYDEQRLRHLLSDLIADQNLGRLILFELAGELVGYIVLGFGFSLEFHGHDCLVDELYVRPAYRSKGIGKAAVEFALELCRDLGIKAVHLEADHFNVRGHEFYKRLGFKDHDRHLMTRWI